MSKVKGPKRPRCGHEKQEEVRSMSGEKLHGWRCLMCGAQFVWQTCIDCAVSSKLPASKAQTKYRCDECVKKLEAAKKPAPVPVAVHHEGDR